MNTVAITKQINEIKQYCEGIEVEIISLRSDLQNSNKWNEEILQVFEEQVNGIKEEIIELRTQVEEERKIEEGLRKEYME